MNSGSFFRLDLRTSKVDEGITLFNYIDVPDLCAKDDEVRFPVKLSVSSDSVSFFVHYFKENDTPPHAEDVILSLPFKSSGTESLASTIKRIYNIEFPLNDYLANLLRYRYPGSTIAPKNPGGPTDKEKEEESIKALYQPLISSQINRDTYSSLFIWDLVIGDTTLSYKIRGDESERITGFLRKVLLDFMFDLMHSDVFECTKYYTQMRDGLLSDFFFSAIVKKCEFYYYRRLVRNRFNDINDNNKYCLDYHKQRRDRFTKLQDTITKRVKEIDQAKREELASIKKSEEVFNDSLGDHKYNSIKHLYAERLWDSETAWVDTIMSPMAEKHFSFTPEWFENKEQRKKRKKFSISDSWFVSPEEEMGRILFPLEKEEKVPQKGQKTGTKQGTVKKDFHYLNSYELSNLMGAKDDIAVVRHNSKISKWLYRRFDLDDAFRMLFFKGWNYALLGVLTFLSVVIIIWPGFLECPYNFALCLALVGGSEFVAALLNYLKSKRDLGRNTLDGLLLCIRRRREARRALQMALILEICALFCRFSEASTCCGVFLRVGAWIAICAAIWLVPKGKKWYRKIHIIDNVHLFLPRLVSSITAAWIILVIGNDILKERLSWPLWIVITIIVFIFILYENSKTLHKVATRQKLWRALELVVISYSMSLVIGIFAINILSVAIPHDYSPYFSSEVIPFTWSLLKDSPDLSFNIYPNILIPFSFLAMFIGVFIQMIFEEKNITEM